MAKNDGIVAIGLLFGAALLWNYRDSILGKPASAANNWTGPAYGGAWRTLIERWSTVTSIGGGGSGDVDTPSALRTTPGLLTRPTPRTYYKTPEATRKAIWKPTNGAGQGFGGGGSGVRGSIEDQKTNGFVGKSAKKKTTTSIFQGLRAQGDLGKIMSIPSGSTKGYSRAGQTEPLM